MKQILHSLLLGILCSVSLAGFARNNSSASTAYFGNIKMFSAFLKTSSGNMADGNRVVFAPNYSNAVDGNDAIKLTNPGENFGILRSNKVLAVEARQPISNDTLFYKTSNLVAQVYKLMLVPQNLETTTSICELVDNYLHTRRVISLSDTTILDHEITSDPASKAANRLMIVFSQLAAGPLPVKFTGISADRGNNNVSVQWKVENEVNILRYEVERSENGRNFSPINTPVNSAGIDGRANYAQADLSPLNVTAFYRVKAVNNNGKLEYSAIVKSAPSSLNDKATLRLYPNPTTDRTVQVQFSNYAKGNYTIRITNMFGQPVYNGTVQANSSNFVKMINLPPAISKGNYNVTVIGEDGKALSQQIVVQ